MFDRQSRGVWYRLLHTSALCLRALPPGARYRRAAPSPPSPPSPTTSAAPPDAPRAVRPPTGKHAFASVTQFWFWLPVTLGVLVGGLCLAREATRDGRSGCRRFWPAWLGGRAWAELDRSRSAATCTSSTAGGVALPPLVREPGPGDGAAIPPPPHDAPAALRSGDDSPASPGADPLALWRAIEGDKQAADALKEKQQRRQQRKQRRRESAEAQTRVDEAGPRATGG